MLMRTMKFLWALIVCLPALALSQGGVWDSAFRTAMDASDVASGRSVFQVARPDLIIQVEKHRVGADMFEIVAVDPSYPAELLQEQANKMCDLLGVPARGLLVGKSTITGNPRLSSTKATFATDGVIDREKGILRIEPILKAFAGAPAPHTVRALTIMFNGEKPNPNVLKSFETEGLRLQAIANENPPVIEYRVQLLSQDPAQLSVPDAAPVEQKPVPSASTVQQNGVDWTLWISLFAAAAAASILVYFLMLRSTAKPRR